MPPKSWIIGAVASVALFFLYFFGLDRTGLLGPDEPRYAAIGREMARSGDWITPRLYGRPWFEKPPLLYWLTAAGFEAHLDDDLAPRLPVAIASVGFLVFYLYSLRRQFGTRAAAYSASILATTAGWLAFSHIAVTDLPMSAAFASAMLLAGAGALVPAGIFLGIAILGKGLVPLVLFIPAIWFLRRRAALVLGLAILVALPWYAAVTLRNGNEFLYEFFWIQHVARFVSGEQLHPRPFWFFMPVLLAGIFPWTPAIGLLFRRELYRDRRLQFFTAWFLFGFVFLSLAKGKLPGYLLPLLPALTALLGIALAQARRAGWFLAFSAGLLWLLPAVEQVLPRALIEGLSRAPLQLPFTVLLPVTALALFCFYLDYKGWRDLAVAAICLSVTAGVFRVVWITYPMLDNSYSARGFFRSEEGRAALCTPSPNRNWRYGLDYYAHRPIPDCK